MLASVKTASNCKTTFSSSTHLPVPADTKVLLDHIEIDPANQELLIFCKVTDDTKWMIDNMVKWKGYTIIAITDLHGSGRNSGWRFKGTGKMSMLEKNVRIKHK